MVSKATHFSSVNRRLEPDSAIFAKGIEMSITSQHPNAENLICVAGASGFLGQAIVKEFSKRGFKVIALTRSNSKLLDKKAFGAIVQIRGAIEDWVSAIELEKPKTIISVDWTGVARELREDEILQESNINRVGLLAQAAKSSMAENFIAFGSQAEVSPSIQSILESAVDDPQNSYGGAKVSTRKLVQKILEGGDTRFIWGRIFTIYGPGDKRDSLITQQIKSLLANQTFTIENPSKKWSFLAIDDFAEALYTLHENSMARGVINIGNPESVTIGSVSDQISNLLGLPNMVLKLNQQNPNSPQLSWIPDTSTLSNLRWAPKIPLELGLENTLNWWKQLPE